MTKSIKWLYARPVAHRGLHDISRGVVENTATAFDHAIAKNYTIECDLQISADGKVMVFHDPTLGRLMRQDGEVNRLSARQLQQISFKDCDDKIQTLEELLEQVDGAVPLVLELKSLADGDVSIAERAVEVLASYKDDYAIMSFGPKLIQAVKALSPHTLRGGVAEPKTENFWLQAGDNAETVLAAADLDFLSYDVKALPSDFVENFRAPEKPVISWTIKDQKTADFALQYCDQITFEGFEPK